MLFRALLVCLVAATLCGCGGGAPLFGPSTGTVSGQVQVRACGGAYKPEQNGCPARPMPGAKVTFQSIGTSKISTVTVDSSGAYRIELKPGTYSVQVTEGGSAAKRGFAGPTTVAVVAGKTVTADFMYTIQLM